MSKSLEWFNLNMEEIYNRTISIDELKNGIIIALQDGNKINLVYCYDDNAKVIRENFICYTSLVKAKTVEERIMIVLDAVRNIKFMFYFENQITDIICNER